MKKNLLWLLIPIVLISAWVPALAQDQQVMANGGMELWNNNGPGGPPDNWTLATPRISALQETGRVHSGTYSVKVVYDSSGTLRLDHAPIPVVPGTTYSCSLWVYDYTPDINNPRVRVWFFFSPSGSSGPSTYSTDIDNWTLYTWSDTARYNSTSLTVQLRFYGGVYGRRDSIWVDDVVLWGQVPQGNTPPVVGPTVRIPAGNVYPDTFVNVKSTIQDIDGTVVSDSLYLQLNGGTFTAAPHDSITGGNDRWFHIGFQPAGTIVNYYVVATDDDGGRSQSQTFTYTVFGYATPYVPIYSVQHTTVQGTLPNCFPTDSLGMGETVTGIVVGRYERSTAGYHMRFFLQDATTPWSGLYVYQSIDTVQVGDSVTVTGIMGEYYAETELSPVSVLTKHSPGHTLPAPNVITCATLGLDSCSATAEPYEGMIIQINNITLIDTLPRPDNGEFLGIDGSGDTCIVSNDLSLGGVDSCVFQMNHQYTYIRGIGRYTYGRYRIMPRTSADLFTAPTVCTGMNIFTLENSLDPGTGDNCWPSPYAGTYQSVCGIVTAVRQATYGTFYLQDQGNTAWGGLYSYDYTLPNGDPVNAHVGDYVQVNGFINEYYGWTELDTIQSFTVLGPSQPLPDTSIVTVATLALKCDYSTEPLESELIRINNVTVLSAGSQLDGKYWIRDNTSTDSIRIDDDMWVGGTNIPSPLPSTGGVYDYIIGVLRWEGRTTSPNVQGWILMPRSGSDYQIGIIPEPNIVAVWPIDNTQLAVTFDRAMNTTSISNPSFYSTVHGLSILGAAASGNRKAILTTAAQPNNSIDSLIVNGVCDSVNVCMVTPHYKLYHSGITSISVVQTPSAGGDSTIYIGDIFTSKVVVTSDSTTSQPSNIFGYDQSGPPYRGIHMYVGGVTPRPVVGDTIIATGKAIEYFQETELSDVSVYGNMQIVGTGPAPIPYQIATSDLMAHGEYYESDLVTDCDSFVVTNTAFDAYGWIIHSLTNPSESLMVVKNGLWTRYTYVPVLGDRIRGITGVYRFEHSFFRISPRTNADFNSSSVWCAGPEGTIAGIVYDHDGTTPLEGVTIITHNAAEVEVGNNLSGVGGTWSLLLPPATYHEHLSKAGYVNNIINNIVVTADQTTNVNATMLESPTGCDYAVGDANNSHVFNGLDVTYSVGYFKGGPPPPYSCECTPGHTWFVAGDVNASCSFNGLDVTYMVSYFKGGPMVHGCPDCLPIVDLAPLVAPQPKVDTQNAQ